MMTRPCVWTVPSSILNVHHASVVSVLAVHLGMESMVQVMPVSLVHLTAYIAIVVFVPNVPRLMD
jgi:hypothetical protein